MGQDRRRRSKDKGPEAGNHNHNSHLGRPEAKERSQVWSSYQKGRVAGLWEGNKEHWQQEVYVGEGMGVGTSYDSNLVNNK